MIVMIVMNVMIVIVIIVLIIITKEGELASSDLGFTTVGFEPLHFAAGGNGDLRAAAAIPHGVSFLLSPSSSLPLSSSSPAQSS